MFAVVLFAFNLSSLSTCIFAFLCQYLLLPPFLVVIVSLCARAPAWADNFLEPQPVDILTISFCLDYYTYMILCNTTENTCWFEDGMPATFRPEE